MAILSGCWTSQRPLIDRLHSWSGLQSGEYEYFYSGNTELIRLTRETGGGYSFDYKEKPHRLALLPVEGDWYAAEMKSGEMVVYAPARLRGSTLEIFPSECDQRIASLPGVGAMGNSYANCQIYSLGGLRQAVSAMRKRFLQGQASANAELRPSRRQVSAPSAGPSSMSLEQCHSVFLSAFNAQTLPTAMKQYYQPCEQRNSPTYWMYRSKYPSADVDKRPWEDRTIAELDQMVADNMQALQYIDMAVEAGQPQNAWLEQYRNQAQVRLDAIRNYLKARQRKIAASAKLAEERDKLDRIKEEARQNCLALKWDVIRARYRGEWSERDAKASTRDHCRELGVEVY